jgi:CRP-like cAMP-binding protein
VRGHPSSAPVAEGTSPTGPVASAWKLTGPLLWEPQLLAIVSGRVECRGEGTRGAFVAGPRYVLGADAALGGVQYCYHAVAATPVVAISVQASALTDLIEDHFELGRRSLEHFAREEIRLQEHASETEPAGAVEAAPRRAAR